MPKTTDRPPLEGIYSVVSYGPQQSRYSPDYVEFEDDSGGNGSSGFAPLTEDVVAELAPYLETRDEAFLLLVDDKDEELTSLMIEDERQFGSVSGSRRKRKKRSEKSASNGAQYTNAADLPAHPLLDTQRFAGLAENDSPVAAANVDVKEALFENLAELVQEHPELRLNPALTNSLQARIDLYNSKKHLSTPEFKMAGA